MWSPMTTSKLLILTLIMTIFFFFFFFFFCILDSTTSRNPDSASDSNHCLVLRLGPDCTSETRHVHTTCAQSATASQKGWWMLMGDRQGLIGTLICSATQYLHRASSREAPFVLFYDPSPIREHQVRCHLAVDYPLFGKEKEFLRAPLEVLAEGCSYSYTPDRRPVLSPGWEAILFDRARSFRRDAHGSVREEGDTCLASQISRIDPGDQWGDRCCIQITLTSHSASPTCWALYTVHFLSLSVIFLIFKITVLIYGSVSSSPVPTQKLAKFPLTQ